MFLDDVLSSLDYADRAIAVSTENDFAFWLGTGLAMRGWCLGKSGDFEVALEVARNGIAVFEGTGAAVQLANWHGLLAEIFLLSGDSTAALDAARDALGFANAVGDI